MMGLKVGAGRAEIAPLVPAPKPVGVPIVPDASVANAGDPGCGNPPAGIVCENAGFEPENTGIRVELGALESVV